MLEKALKGWIPLRTANIEDLPRIVDIYNKAIPSGFSTADVQPVSIEQKFQWFKEHRPKHRPILVEENDNQVIAWLSFENFYGRPAYSSTAELSIYVDPEFQGNGYGRRLLSHALEIAPGLQLDNLVAFIFSDNTHSIRLFEGFGFSQWGQLPNVANVYGEKHSLSILGICITE